jgi:hypothetical protein
MPARASNGRQRLVQPPSWLSSVEFDAGLDAHDPDRSAPRKERLVARTMRLAPGPCEIAKIGPDPNGWLGLAVLDGLMLVEADAGRGPAGWLVGADDLVRPWDMTQIALTADARWTVLSQSRIALLDGEFARRMAGNPGTVQALVAKATRTTHWLLAKALITATPIVEERLLLLFALLCERWGRATADGITLQLPLTHRLLAILVGAQRPSVSTALGALAEGGLVWRDQDQGWLIRRAGHYPMTDRPRVWQRYVEVLGFDVSAGERRSAR